MSTEYGIIKSYRWNTTIEVCSTIEQGKITFLIESHEEDCQSPIIRQKFILDQENIDDFLGAIQCALHEKNIFSNYLHPDGEYKK